MQVHSINSYASYKNVTKNGSFDKKFVQNDIQRSSQNFGYDCCNVPIFGSAYTNKVVKLSNITQKDFLYYKKLQHALLKEGIHVNLKALKNIVAPHEFKTLVAKFKQEDFQAGMFASYADAERIPDEVFYKNAIDGNFRVSLHSHSTASDGKATPLEVLECARKYADKVANLHKNEEIPPFTFALTDHDTLEGCKEIVRQIAKNPEKYKNVKFIAGCEFSVKNGDEFHDITGLALNPFDMYLTNELVDLSKKRRKNINNFLKEENAYYNKKVSFNDLVEYEKISHIKEHKNLKQSIKNCASISAVKYALKLFYEITGLKPDKDLISAVSKKDVLPITKVLALIDRDGGYAALTHPIKSFWKYIGDDEMLNLKNMGVSGIELNHQYRPKNISKLSIVNKNDGNELDYFYKVNQSYKDFAEKHQMFLAGGTDSHEVQIFSKEPIITDEVLKKILS